MFRLSRCAHAREQILVGILQSVGGAREDGVDRAGADARAEELFAELDHVAAAHAVAYRQRRDSRLQTRPESAI